MNGYNLSRDWFDWTFENPEKHNPNHTALYMWIIEQWNRQGQKEKFGLPTFYSMQACGIKSPNTYHKTLKSLIDFGFIQIVQKSINQNTSMIITLSAYSKIESADDTAHKSALDIALIQHSSQQVKDYKQINNITIKQLNKETTEEQKDILVINNNPDNPYNVDAYVKTLPDTDRQYVTDDFIYYASKFGHKWGYTERADDVRTWLKQLQSIHGHTADEMRSIIFQWYTYWIGQPEKKRPKDCKASLSKNPFMKNKYGK